MIKGILFDKDGTLLDFNATWLDAYIQAANHIARSVGQPKLAESLLRSGGYDTATGQWGADSLLASGGNQQILDFWSEQLGQPLNGPRLSAIQDIFSHAAGNPVPAIENLREFLLELKDRGLKTGLATMDDERNAVLMIEKLALVNCFDFVCGADSGYGEKPDPGMIEAFCRYCDLVPAQVIMVGDSPKDIHMGIRAGAALCVGVLTGSHNRHELGKHTNTVLDNIAELGDLLTQ